MVSAAAMQRPHARRHCPCWCMLSMILKCANSFAVGTKRRHGRSRLCLVQASDDDAATVRGIAICFIDDLTTVQYVPFDGNRSSILQLVDQQVRAPSFQPTFFFSLFFQLWRRRKVFASRDRSNRVACKVTHPIRDAVLAMAQLWPSGSERWFSLIRWPSCMLAIVDAVLRCTMLPIVPHRAAVSRSTRRRLPPFQCAVMRAVQAAADHALAAARRCCQLQLCVASRTGVLLAQVERRGIAVDCARLDALLKRARTLSQQCERHALALARVSDLVALRAAVLTRGERLSLGSLERAAHPAAAWWARSRRIESLIRHGEALMACALPSGTVHCRFDGAHHENGRINSVDPNLQCLPKALCVLVPNRGSQDDERLALRSCVVARAKLRACVGRLSPNGAASGGSAVGRESGC
jgi:hypothetical protein